ncbi:MAG: hypothetical protein IJJ66_07790 [Treponema sp.]|nr:hypothetical protein [Treponema sp.]MBR0476702.1 hypothetical protein [Treponema sp.]
MNHEFFVYFDNVPFDKLREHFFCFLPKNIKPWRDLFYETYAAVEPRSCHEVAMSVSEGWKGGDELACWPILDKKQVAEHQKVPSIYRKKKIS